MSRLGRKVSFFGRMAEFLPNLKDIWSLTSGHRGKRHAPDSPGHNNCPIAGFWVRTVLRDVAVSAKRRGCDEALQNTF
jgi:hypothetical protein